MKVDSLLQQISQQLRLAPGVHDPNLEARIILGSYLNKTSIELLMWPSLEVFKEQYDKIQAAVFRRLSGEPMAYILNQKEFYRRVFYVHSGVFIPRPETELLVGAALQWQRQQDGFLERPWQVADLGCGSGAIGITLALESPRTHVSLIDHCAQALSVSAKNVLYHQNENPSLQGRISYCQIDLNHSRPDQESFDMILGNPPYIDRDDLAIDPWVKQYEPEHALFAHEGGFFCLGKWLQWAYIALKKGGWLGFEHGYNQGPMVKETLDKLGLVEVSAIYDYQGFWRHTFAIKKVE